MRSILTALQEGRLFELPETGKDRCLEFLARILEANPDIEVGTEAIEAIQRREQECNTGIGMGVAVPHLRARREEGELFCAIGWSPKGVDYGASDGRAVHLVCMYYIPGAQKNVYLKEISSLVKAMRKTGGIDPIAMASDLNVVRNLLLDWITDVAADSGPEAVARMIKLEVKQAQAPYAPSLPVVPSPTAGPARLRKAVPFSLVVNGASTIVLAPDPELLAALEKEPDLLTKIDRTGSAAVGNNVVFMTAARQFSGGRTLYEFVAVPSPGPRGSPPENRVQPG